VQTRGRINKDLKVNNDSLIHMVGTQIGKIEVEANSGMILNK
jgi:hypothetical protein